MRFIPDILVIASLLAIAAGRVRPLLVNRAGIAFAGASLVLLHARYTQGPEGLERLLEAINAPTLLLLTSMMIFATNLSLSGFFSLAVWRIRRSQLSPARLLALVMIVSGLFSALFINDTAVIMLSPLLIQLCIELDIDPRPQLLGLAMGTNTGSALTLVGNPQNILIAGMSNLDFGRFTLVMALPVCVSLAIGYLFLRLFWRASFKKGPAQGNTIKGGGPSLATSGAPDAVLPANFMTTTAPRVYRPLMFKSLASLALFFIAVLAGMPAHLAGLLCAALLLVTRRVAPDKVFRNVDWTLPVFFAGLFVITAAARETIGFHRLEELLLPVFQEGSLLQSGIIAAFSQIISNVPTVMLLSPLSAASPSPEAAWTILAAASTMAANLTILGAVANLLVAEAAAKRGIHIGFADFLKAGFPSTVLSLLGTTLWIAFIYRLPL